MKGGFSSIWAMGESEGGLWKENGEKSNHSGGDKPPLKAEGHRKVKGNDTKEKFGGGKKKC